MRNAARTEDEAPHHSVSNEFWPQGEKRRDDLEAVLEIEQLKKSTKTCPAFWPLILWDDAVFVFEIFFAVRRN